jgi:hypothetical protein
MQQCKCQLYTSILTQPSSIFCFSKPYYVEKGMSMAKKRNWFQGLDLNQKI